MRVASSRSTQTGRPPNDGVGDCFGAIILGIAYKYTHLCSHEIDARVHARTTAQTNERKRKNNKKKRQSCLFAFAGENMYSIKRRNVNLPSYQCTIILACVRRVI